MVSARRCGKHKLPTQHRHNAATARAPHHKCAHACTVSIHTVRTASPVLKLMMRRRVTPTPADLTRPVTFSPAERFSKPAARVERSDGPRPSASGGRLAGARGLRGGLPVQAPPAEAPSPPFLLCPAVDCMLPLPLWLCSRGTSSCSIILTRPTEAARHTVALPKRRQENKAAFKQEKPSSSTRRDAVPATVPLQHGLADGACISVAWSPRAAEGESRGGVKWSKSPPFYGGGLLQFCLSKNVLGFKTIKRSRPENDVLKT